MLTQDLSLAGVQSGATPYIAGRIPARPHQDLFGYDIYHNGPRYRSEIVEEGPIFQEVSYDKRLDSPGHTRTDNPRMVENHTPSPAVQATANASLKRTHDEFAESDNMWTETRFRKGHGIRLLRLHGGASISPLQGRLILSDGKETYEALSYGGGPIEGSSTITIFSAGSTYKLAIKPNLEAALRHLRFAERYRLLWIDVICINQEDNQERNHHIQRMGSIFNTASNVCIWLGTADNQTGLAFESIRNLEHTYDLNVDTEEEDTRTALDAIINLLERRWFTRRWAIQEVALAKRATLYCGNDSIPWAEFVDAISLLLSNLSRLLPRNAPEFGSRASARARTLESTAGCYFVNICSNIFRKSDEGTILDSLQSLESLVCNLSAFETSRFHDNIYAYVSLAEDTGAQYSIRAAAAFSMNIDDTAFEPIELSMNQRRLAQNVVDTWRSRRKETEYRIDYEKSVVEVCKDFVSFVVSNTRSLDIICRPWAPAAQKSELPSWVATLADTNFKHGHHARAQADALAGPASMKKKPYNASRRSSMSFNFGKQPDSKSLFADGSILDSIKERRETADSGIPEGWRELVGWQESASSPPERFWRTLIANRGHDGANPPHYFQRACRIFFAKETTENGEYLTTIRRDHPEFVAQFLQRVQAITWRRRMIMTEQERLLGLAPETAQEGDLVCIIFGCSVPVLLRKIISDEMTGEHHYELVGDCYIHGMMDGEALTMQQTRNIPQTQFELR
jgi:hypothetical protein